MTEPVAPVTPRYEEVVGAAMLDAPNSLPTSDDLDALWVIVEGIEATWFSERRANSMKPQWLDYIRANVEESPSLLGEYENAIAVYKEIVETVPERLPELLILRSVPALSATSTRLDHAKRFVVDRFIRCYVMLGGFQEFGGRNYNGYMGGSRFADTAPVRVGGRQ